jgi:antitoxin component YwqK of YwqJK toxin-antitoxin module
MRVIGILMMVVLTLNVALAQEVDRDSYVKNGKLIEATLYHDNGVVAQQGFYNSEGKLHGQWISYDLEGKKTAIGNYNNGVKTGTWFFWVNDELHEAVYQESRLTTVNSWESTGVQVVSNND